MPEPAAGEQPRFLLETYRQMAIRRQKQKSHRQRWHHNRNLTEAVREKIPSHNQDHAGKAVTNAKRLRLVHTVNGKNNAKLFHLGPDPAQAVQQQWVDTHARVPVGEIAQEIRDAL